MKLITSENGSYYFQILSDHLNGETEGSSWAKHVQAPSPLTYHRLCVYQWMREEWNCLEYFRTQFTGKSFEDIFQVRFLQFSASLPGNTALYISRSVSVCSFECIIVLLGMISVNSYYTSNFFYSQNFFSLVLLFGSPSSVPTVSSPPVAIRLKFAKVT